MSAPSVVPARPKTASGRITAAFALPATPHGLATVAWTVLSALLLLIPVGAVCQIVLTSQFDDRSPTQAIVVMDAGRYWGNGAPVRTARLDHAADLYRAGVAPVVIVVGPEHESARSRDRLSAMGVPAGDVVTFESGADTLGSLRVIASVMRDLGWQSATIVTDPAMAARTEATASGYGLDAHLSPAASGPGAALTSEYVGRETAALLRYYVLNRWTQATIIPTHA